MTGVGVTFTTLEALVPFAKLRAQRGIYDGRDRPATWRLLELCTHRLKRAPALEIVMIFTRDAGHHSAGWWKNPQYERCLHLSISFRSQPSDESAPFDKRQAEAIARAFFGDDARKCWVEPPVTPEGRYYDIWHYRLFCDAGWQPLLPKGEVYSRADTPAGWKSFSELHGFTPEPEDAPFLRGASE